MDRTRKNSLLFGAAKRSAMPSGGTKKVLCHVYLPGGSWKVRPGLRWGKTRQACHDRVLGNFLKLDLAILWPFGKTAKKVANHEPEN